MNIDLIAKIKDYQTFVDNYTVVYDSSNVAIFYGEGVREEDASILQSRLEERHPELDVSVVFGGQPVYYYIISVE